MKWHSCSTTCFHSEWYSTVLKRHWCVTLQSSKLNFGNITNQQWHQSIHCVSVAQECLLGRRLKWKQSRLLSVVRVATLDQWHMYYFVNLLKLFRTGQWLGCLKAHDNIIMDKVYNPDHPTLVGFTHKFAYVSKANRGMHWGTGAKSYFKTFIKLFL